MLTFDSDGLSNVAQPKTHIKQQLFQDNLGALGSQVDWNRPNFKKFISLRTIYLVVVFFYLQLTHGNDNN